MSTTENADLAFVEETMTEVRRNWNVMVQDSFNPIMVALEMLQNSNSSHDFNSFCRLQSQLDDAMAIIVDKYYNSFNNAVSIFSGIVDNSKLSKDIVGGIKEEILEFQSQVQYKRTELPEVWAKVQQYKNSLAVSEKIESIKKRQVRAADMAKQCFFIPASRLLMDGIYETKNLLETGISVPQCSELFKTLENLQSNVFETIIEEVHDVIYLKKAMAAEQMFAILAAQIPEVKSLSVGDMKRSTTAAFNSNVDDLDLTLEPSEFNFDPKSNYSAYLTSLLRAVVILEMVPQFLDSIAQRIVSELFLLVEGHLLKLKKDFWRDYGEKEIPLFIPILRGLTLEKVDWKEFDSFGPHLKRLCDRVFGTLLTIWSNICLIGRTITNIHSEGGPNTSSLDLTIFYRSTLDAIHGEARNFIATFLHGSHHQPNTRIFTNSTVAISEALKGGGKKQSKVQTPLFQFIPKSDQGNLPALPKLNSIMSEREIAAAQKTASMLTVDPFSLSNKTGRHLTIVRPNLQYITLIYRPFAQFDVWIQTVCDKEQVNIESKAFSDAVYIESVLSQEFIPALENYLFQELTKSSNSAESLLWHSLSTSPSIDSTLPIGKGSDSLLMFVSKFMGLMCQAANILNQIPGCQADAERLLHCLMVQFLEKCNIKFRELITSKESVDSSSAFVALSSSLIANTELSELLQRFLNHHLKEEGNDEELEALYAQKESILLEKLKNDRSLYRNEIIFDYRVLRTLLLLQRSVELLPRLLADGNFGVIPSFPTNRPEFLYGEDGNLKCNFFDGVSRRVIQCSSTFEIQFNNFLHALQNLSQTCLFLIRVELRLHCVYFLDLVHREGKYDLEENSSDPDSYITSLASDLIRFESLLSEWLPFTRYHAIMDGLDQNLISMLFNGFKYIRALNTAGCAKLEHNVSTLEQILALISAGSLNSLQTVHAFYRLASKGPSNFMEEAIKSKHRFSKEQYESILQKYYPNWATDRTVRETFSNESARLKYLLDGLKHDSAS